MNGVHDMGGMHGFGPVAPDVDAPAFHEPWEARVFAMAMTVRPGGIRRLIEQLPPERYLSSSYYERWLAALEERLVSRAGLTREEIDARAAHYLAQPAAPLPERGDAALAARTVARLWEHERIDQADGPAPRYAAGDAVRARNVHPAGHTRLPRYVRGRRGTIARLHGVHDFDDEAWPGAIDGPQALYAVRFAAQELWGPHGGPTDAVYVDLWESHLEPA